MPYDDDVRLVMCGAVMFMADNITSSCSGDIFRNMDIATKPNASLQLDCMHFHKRRTCYLGYSIKVGMRFDCNR